MLQSPQNDLIITLDKVFQDQIGSLYVDTRFNPGEHANLVGTVVSVPRIITTNRPDYKGFSTEGILPGDKILFRYDVVYSYRAQPQRTNPIYKFELFYKGKSYWRCDIQKVFAVIRDGDFIMLNGYVMVAPFQEPTRLFIPGHLKQLQRMVESEIWHIGKPLEHLPPIDAKPGDKAIFNPRRAQRYHFGRDEFVILKQSQILGIACN